MATFLLDLVEQREKNAEAERSLKESLLATGKFDMQTLWPDWFEEPAESIDSTDEKRVAALLAEDNEGQTQGANYDFSEAKYDPAEAERLLASLLGETSSGTVSGTDLNDGWV